MIIDFQVLTHPRWEWIHIVLRFISFYVLVDLTCWYFVKDFCIYTPSLSFVLYFSSTSVINPTMYCSFCFKQSLGFFKIKRKKSIAFCIFYIFVIFILYFFLWIHVSIIYFLITFSRTFCCMCLYIIYLFMLVISSLNFYISKKYCSHLQIWFSLDIGICRKTFSLSSDCTIFDMLMSLIFVFFHLF